MANLRCALFGHKYKPFIDTFKVDMKHGPAITVEVKTCERCGKKAYRVVGKGHVSSSDGKTKLNMQFTFQPTVIRDWDVKTNK